MSRLRRTPAFLTAALALSVGTSRVHAQENLLVRLRSAGRASDQAEGMLVEMRTLLDDLRDHLERLQQKREG